MRQQDALSRYLLVMIVLLADIFGLDHVRGEKEVQDVAEYRNVFEGILLRIVRGVRSKKH